MQDFEKICKFFGRNCHFLFCIQCLSLHCICKTHITRAEKRLKKHIINIAYPIIENETTRNGTKKHLIIMTTTLVIIIIVAILAIWLVVIYNRLVKLRNNRENAFANIDVQLKQRCDLIPQLVATVKGYATHEKETLQRVTDARAASMGAQTINDKIHADSMMTNALAGLKIQLEAYPDLKANQNFIQLQEEIADIENKLAAVRRFFNSATRELNNAVETFPSNIFAKMFGFSRQPMFEIPQENRAAAEKAPEIQF